MQRLFGVLMLSAMLLCFPPALLAQSGEVADLQLSNGMENDLSREDPPEYKAFIRQLNAVFEKEGVLLKWVTVSERNNARFEVERSVHTHEAGAQTWSTLAFISSKGSSDEPVRYTYHDKGDLAGASQLVYRLKQVSYDGTFQYSEILDAELPIPEGYAVHSYQQAENIASVEYDIPVLGHVRLTIYDETGRRIATLINKKQAPGRYRAEFDASAKPAGLYMYRLEAGPQARFEPLLLKIGF